MTNPFRTSLHELAQAFLEELEPSASSIITSGALFNSIGLDLAWHDDALDKVRAHCPKTCLDIAGVVPLSIPMVSQRSP